MSICACALQPSTSSFRRRAWVSSDFLRISSNLFSVSRSCFRRKSPIVRARSASIRTIWRCMSALACFVRLDSSFRRVFRASICLWYALTVSVYSLSYISCKPLTRKSSRACCACVWILALSFAVWAACFAACFLSFSCLFLSASSSFLNEAICERIRRVPSENSFSASITATRRSVIESFISSSSFS